MNKPTKFEVALADGKLTLPKDFAQTKLNIEILIDELFKHLKTYHKIAMYMDMHHRFGVPDEKQKLFFQTLIDHNGNHVLTARSLNISKAAVKLRLYRLEKTIARKSQA